MSSRPQQALLETKRPLWFFLTHQNQRHQIISWLTENLDDVIQTLNVGDFSPQDTGMWRADTYTQTPYDRATSSSLPWCPSQQKGGSGKPLLRLH